MASYPQDFEVVYCFFCKCDLFHNLKTQLLIFYLHLATSKLFSSSDVLSRKYSFDFTKKWPKVVTIQREIGDSSPVKFNKKQWIKVCISRACEIVGAYYRVSDAKRIPKHMLAKFIIFARSRQNFKHGSVYLSRVLRLKGIHTEN